MWKKVVSNGDIPTPRRRSTMVEYKDSIYIFGGYNDESCDKLFKFNPISSSWKEIKTKQRPPKRAGHVASIIKDNMIIQGGNAKNYGPPHDDVWVYNFPSNNWTKIPVKTQLKRQFHVSVVYQNHFLIQGGCDELSFYNDIYVLKDSEFYRLNVQGNVYPKKLVSHSAIVIYHSLYICGGVDDPQATRCENDLYEFNFLTNKWREIETFKKFSPRCNASVTLYQNKIILFGGYDHSHDELKDDFYIFDFEKKNWNQVDFEERPTKRTKHCMVRNEDSIFIYSGFGKNGRICEDLSDFYSYDLGLIDLKKNMKKGLSKSIYSDILFVYKS